jgi:hypothetical protein
MRRGMSYRKPAPVWVPSPPASPALEPSFLMASGADKLYRVSSFSSFTFLAYLVLAPVKSFGSQGKALANNTGKKTGSRRLGDKTLDFFQKN